MGALVQCATPHQSGPVNLFRLSLFNCDSIVSTARNVDLEQLHSHLVPYHVRDEEGKVPGPQLQALSTARRCRSPSFHDELPSFQ